MKAIVNSVENLRQLSPERVKVVYVSGYYHRGDGGGGWYTWEIGTQRQDNGGTIIASTRDDTGRWYLTHKGMGDFRMFGIFDDTHPADDALDALINDPTITWSRLIAIYYFVAVIAFNVRGSLWTFSPFIFLHRELSLLRETILSPPYCFSRAYRKQTSGMWY